MIYAALWVASALFLGWLVLLVLGWLLAHPKALGALLLCAAAFAVWVVAVVSDSEQHNSRPPAAPVAINAPPATASGPVATNPLQPQSQGDSGDLYRAYLSRKSQAQKPLAAGNHAPHRAKGTGTAPRRGDRAPARYFTVGSNKAQVASVQGTPDGIRTYGALDEEVWDYGLSTVTFSALSGTVTEWSDAGRVLRVYLAPTSIPDAAFITVGSSKDEVLHVQGTPSGLHTYRALNEEVWDYGLSTVTFSLTTGSVQEWSNIGKRLRVRVTP